MAASIVVETESGASKEALRRRNGYWAGSFRFDQHRVIQVTAAHDSRRHERVDYLPPAAKSA